MNKLKCGILGSGNIGTDLLVKLMRSDYLEPHVLCGVRSNSPGLQFANKLGIRTSTESIEELELRDCQVVFDATSTCSHRIHAPRLESMGIFTIDMTPSRIGRMCVPSINLDECLKEPNVNMVTCGGQAILPIARTVMRVCPQTTYLETVSNIASRSAGIGTRDNMDDYVETTADALEILAQAPEAKAILTVNPAEPPVTMRNTLYALVSKPDLPLLRGEIEQTVRAMRTYVPNYQVLLNAVDEGNRITTTVRVEGRGDYLPAYAGNLDVINCTAIVVAEEYARRNR